MIERREKGRLMKLKTKKLGQWLLDKTVRVRSEKNKKQRRSQGAE